METLEEAGAEQADAIISTEQPDLLAFSSQEETTHRRNWSYYREPSR